MTNFISVLQVSLKKHMFVKLATLIYFFTYFFYRSRSPFPFYNITNVSLIIEVGFFASAFSLGVIYDIRNRKYNARPRFLLYILCAFFFILCHSLFSEAAYSDSNIVNRVSNLVRMFFYVSMTLIFARYYFDRDMFVRFLYNFSFYLTLCTLILYCFNPYWFSDVGYGVPRPAFLLSEPSAFAPIVSYLFFSSLQQRKVLGAFISIVLVYLLQSGVTYVVFFTTLCLYLTVINKRVLVLFLFVLSIIVFYFISSYDQIKESHYVIERVESAVVNTNIESGKGGTARIITLLNLYDVISDDARYYYGRGLNSAKVFFGTAWEYREFSLIHLYLFSFGMIGLSILTVALSITYGYIFRSGDVLMMIAFGAFTSASLINSAGGTVLHKFCYLFVFVAILNIKWRNDSTTSRAFSN